MVPSRVKRLILKNIFWLCLFTNHVHKPSTETLKASTKVLIWVNYPFSYLLYKMAFQLLVIFFIMLTVQFICRMFLLLVWNHGCFDRTDLNLETAHTAFSRTSPRIKAPKGEWLRYSQVFCCEICEIFQNICVTEHLRATASAWHTGKVEPGTQDIQVGT